MSGVGDDANPCSRTAPCKTFAGAISKTATFGEINALDPAGFGAVTITKSITIDGGPGVAGVLAASTNGIVINSASAIVNLRNLDINGINGSAAPGLNGIDVLAAAAVLIENAKIYAFSQAGVNFTPSGNAQLAINNSTITDNVGGGILVKPGAAAAAGAQIFNVTSSRNKFGLRVEDRGKASAFDSIFGGNSSNGVVAIANAAPSEINVKSSTTSNNGAFGILASGAGATISISNVGVFDNVTGIAGQNSGAVVSFGNNQNFGNATPGGPTQVFVQQ